jgi:hypothetical protein
MRGKKEISEKNALSRVCPRTVCSGRSVIRVAINAVWQETVAELERVSIFVLHDFSAAVLHSIAASSILPCSFVAIVGACEARQQQML